MRKTEFPPAPLVFALIIGPILENALRQSLLHSPGDFSIFFTRPISAILILVSLILLIVPAFFKGSEERNKVLEALTDD